MQKQDRLAVSGADVGVSNAQQARVDLLQCAERGVLPPVRRCPSAGLIPGAIRLVPRFA